VISLYLTDEEKRMLNGEYGEGTAIAMKVQVGIGEAFGAKRMLEISRAHVALSNQEADLWFVEKLVNAGAYCSVPPTVNPGFDLEYFQKITNVSEEEVTMMKRTREAYKKIGAILTYDCTPYLGSNIPRMGEIIAFSESSATPYVNSVWGARSNREASQSALCAAVTGKVPEYGFLLDENRYGNILVEVQAEIKNEYDYQLLGFTGKKIGHGVPVFTGLPDKISPEELMNLGAQLNTAGAFSMFHILGFTPEAPDLETAFGGKKPERKVVITREDLNEIGEYFMPHGGKVDFALLGCPFLTINQVGKIVAILKGERFRVDTYILVNSLTKELAEKMGYLKVIENAGGHLVKDTCMDQPPFWNNMKGKFGITESPKCAFYSRRRGINYAVLELQECIKTAIKGVI